MTCENTSTTPRCSKEPYGAGVAKFVGGAESTRRIRKTRSRTRYNIPYSHPCVPLFSPAEPFGCRLLAWFWWQQSTNLLLFCNAWCLRIPLAKLVAVLTFPERKEFRTDTCIKKDPLKKRGSVVGGS